MKVPIYHNAKVSQEKILNYLLSEIHPLGKFKSRFFRKLGFNEENVSFFKEVLLNLLKTNDATEMIPFNFGTKYIVDGKIKTPSCKTTIIRTRWIIEKGKRTPVLVTTYPK